MAVTSGEEDFPHWLNHLDGDTNQARCGLMLFDVQTHSDMMHISNFLCINMQNLKERIFITSGAAGRKQREDFSNLSSSLMFHWFHWFSSGSRFGLQIAVGCFIRWRPCASFIAMNTLLPGRSEQFWPVEMIPTDSCSRERQKREIGTVEPNTANRHGSAAPIGCVSETLRNKKRIVNLYFKSS